ENPTSPAVRAKVRASLDERRVDLVLAVPRSFSDDLEAADQPEIVVMSRPNDERSSLVSTRVAGLLNRWGSKLAEVRLARLGLPPDYDKPFVRIDDPEKGNTSGERATKELINMLVRVLPFVLVMWALAGALYPAIDLCAGEKERGTMETLLISPASREEIVWG